MFFFYAPTPAVIGALSVEVVVVVTPTPPIGGGLGHAGWDEKAYRRRKAIEDAFEKDIRSVYRKLHGLPEVKAEVEALLEPIAEKVEVRGKPKFKVDWSLLSAELELALRQIELRRLEIQLSQDEYAVILILLALS